MSFCAWLRACLILMSLTMKVVPQKGCRAGLALLKWVELWISLALHSVERVSGKGGAFVYV